MNLKKIIKCIRKNNNFLITSHTSAEGDALGSELAFYRLIKALGKKATVLNEDYLPYGYDFLPGVTNIRKFKKNARKIPFDVLVVLDCSDLKRTGEVYTINQDNKPVINIDHHISNSRFGSFNWVEPFASSTSEMIYKLFKKMRLPVDKDSALLLYVGILTDTGSFRYSNTTAATHAIIARLLGHRFNIPQIYKQVYEDIPFADMKLLSMILPTMKRELGGKIVWFQIKKDVIKRQKAISFDLTEHILSFARSIKDVEVALLFKENLTEEHEEVRVNFRSQGKIDVNKVASSFGGGGHKTASGCTIKGEIDKVRRKVLARVRLAFSS